VGPDEPVYIIAELSANHGQSFEHAVKLIEAARESGADAIKLQTYTPDTITLDSDSSLFRIGAGSIWSGRTLYDLYREAFMPWEWQPKLKEIANRAGLQLFSSPFDASSVEFLERMNVPAYKIASFELVDLPLIRVAAKTGKPLIISTGMGDLGEIEDAVNAAEESGGAGLALLKCTSAYPASADEMNLRTIPDLMTRFRVPIGLSDHTTGVAVPAAAVTLGACIVEKHLTLARSDGGPDSAFSLEPGEFAEMVRTIRTVERSLGHVQYGARGREASSVSLRRSLFITHDLPAGTALSAENVRSIRPAAGLAPKHYEAVLGRRLAHDVKRGTPLTWDLLA
jgi:N-acetylneuraminate synthase